MQVEPVGDRPVVEVLLLGGRSGVGKTSVGFEVSAQLQAGGVAHCLIDGDNLDAAYPKPSDDPSGERLVETNLRALWSTYAAAGYHRLVYVNTISVLVAGLIRRAVAPDAIVHGVLLTADDKTVHQRLHGREIGSTLTRHLEASFARDVQLKATAEPWVVRVPTDSRPLATIAADVVAVTTWATRR